jgi:two-component system response regulator VicR
MNNTARVLLVEDEPSIAFCFTYALKKAGFHVSTARTGYDARALVTDSCFDLAIIDMSLPDGDGPTLLAELMSICPCMKVIATSGMMDGIRHLAFRAGATEALQKPITPAQLLAAASGVLGPTGQPRLSRPRPNPLTQFSTVVVR